MRTCGGPGEGGGHLVVVAGTTVGSRRSGDGVGSIHSCPPPQLQQGARREFTAGPSSRRSIMLNVLIHTYRLLRYGFHSGTLTNATSLEFEQTFPNWRGWLNLGEPADPDGLRGEICKETRRPTSARAWDPDHVSQSVSVKSCQPTPGESDPPQ